MFMYYVSIGIFWRGEQGMNFELAEVPQGRARATPLTETAVAVGAKSKSPDAAYRALRSLVGAAEKTALVPPRRSLARDLRKVESRLSDQDIRVITNSLEYARGTGLPEPSAQWRPRSATSWQTQALSAAR